MTFKKILKIKNGQKAQTSLEYFIIMSMVVLLTLVSLASYTYGHNNRHSTSFIGKVNSSLEVFFTNGVKSLTVDKGAGNEIR